jgi:phosphatidylinositol alpha-mannosyltransferase
VLDDGNAGVLVPVGDAEALATAAGELLDDADRRRTLSAAARTLVRKYDWPVVARQIVHVYETVAVDGLGVRTVPAPPPQVVPQ